MRGLARGAAFLLVILVGLAALSSGPFQTRLTDALDERIEQLPAARALETQGKVSWHGSIRTAIEAGVYLALGLSLALGFSLHGWQASFLAALAAAVSEASHLLHPQRLFEWHDLALNAVAAVLGGMAGGLWRRR